MLSGAAQDKRPTIRAIADMVSVPVLVERGGEPVGGLTAADFEIRDNGMLQPPAYVADASVPVDLTVVIDTSGSVQADRASPRFARIPVLKLIVDV